MNGQPMIPRTLSLPAGVLAPWACDPARSRGRRHAEADAPTRTPFQRDRDRIVHSSAFRRLVYKTQVFLNHEGDLFRTRLTHTLEVAQLGRSMARTLGLSEDLVEAIALAHDLGHTPFGHAGQDALDDCMRGYGGFEHNLQSLRVVDRLEERYPDYDGLNLCFETREGILKHCSRANAQRIEADEPDGVGRRFLERSSPSLEAQLTNLADEIAYNTHDIDDGIRSGLLVIEQLEEVELFEQHRRAVLADHPQLKGKRLLHEIIRRMLSALVYDLIDASVARLQAAAPASVDQVRTLSPLVGFSAPVAEQCADLKRFLRHNLYRHAQVVETMERAQQVVQELFQLYLAQPELMSPDYVQRDLHAPRELAASEGKPRVVADYIAGMTDRYALREHARLTGRDILIDG